MHAVKLKCSDLTVHYRFEEPNSPFVNFVLINNYCKFRDCS